jgi:hypothetical protein
MKKKKADDFLETEKKEKNTKRVDKSELTTLKSNVGWYYFDGSWQLVYYSGILKAMERNPK